MDKSHQRTTVHHHREASSSTTGPAGATAGSRRPRPVEYEQWEKWARGTKPSCIVSDLLSDTVDPIVERHMRMQTTESATSGGQPPVKKQRCVLYPTPSTSPTPNYNSQRKQKQLRQQQEQHKELSSPGRSRHHKGLNEQYGKVSPWEYGIRRESIRRDTLGYGNSAAGVVDPASEQSHNSSNTGIRSSKYGNRKSKKYQSIYPSQYPQQQQCRRDHVSNEERDDWFENLDDFELLRVSSHGFPGCSGHGSAFPGQHYGNQQLQQPGMSSLKKKKKTTMLEDCSYPAFTDLQCQDPARETTGGTAATTTTAAGTTQTSRTVGSNSHSGHHSHNTAAAAPGGDNVLDRLPVSLDGYAVSVLDQDTVELARQCGKAVRITCLTCATALWSTPDATMVLCPACGTLAPMDLLLDMITFVASSGTTRAGIATPVTSS